jgi:hypothetical protein
MTKAGMEDRKGVKKRLEATQATWGKAPRRVTNEP